MTAWRRGPSACALAALLLFASSASAQELPLPIVDVKAVPGEVLVGEALTLRVDVFVPTWFAKPPTFPSFEIPNAIVRRPPNGSRPTTRRVNGDTWSGITRTYQVFPLVGADFRLDSRSIGIRYANPGQDPVNVEVPTPAIEFSALVPVGAEALEPYLAGERFTVTREVQGDVSALAVGDALVVTYTAELDGLPDIFIPELAPVGELAGVSAYPEQPELEEGPPARRSERVTYVFNAGGEFELPGTSFEWWNTESDSVETVSLASLAISVEGPALEQPPEEPAREIDWRMVIALLIGLAVLLRWGPRAWRLLEDTYRERRERVEASEGYAWKKARQALASGDPHRAYGELTHWVDRIAPGSDLRSFAARYGDSALRSNLNGLNRVLYDDSNDQAPLGPIATGLSSARERRLEETAAAVEETLPRLNP